MKPFLIRLAALICISIHTAQVHPAEEQGITWLVEYNASQLPVKSVWSHRGITNAQLKSGALQIMDDSEKAENSFRAKWKADPDLEIVVEARVKLGAIKAWRGGPLVWPWRDGSPACLLVSDGQHEDGFVLSPARVYTFTDRVHIMNTIQDFHTYRLIIRGTNMSMEVDGKRVIKGEGAFQKPAKSSVPYIQFGSNSGFATGDSHWQYVKLGVRKPTVTWPSSPLKITISKPWDIKHSENVHQDRPYLYNMGQGLLMMSMAQGPDAYYEPYGVSRSNDGGKTWQPIEGLTLKTFAPMPMMRLPNGRIMGVSRWNVRYRNGIYVGMTYHFDNKGEKFTMFENRIEMPKGSPPIVVFDRHLFGEKDGSILAVVRGGKQNHFLRSSDDGKNWKYHRKICDGGEAAVARFSDNEMTTVFRQGTMRPMKQIWTKDGGKTWSEPVTREESSVDPDVVVMSNGVLACSYGRPCSCIMFSLDKGKTWSRHKLISEQAGYNYTSIREISPGRLLYVHDAPTLRAHYIDVHIEPQR